MIIEGTVQKILQEDDFNYVAFREFGDFQVTANLRKRIVTHFFATVKRHDGRLVTVDA